MSSAASSSNTSSLRIQIPEAFSGLWEPHRYKVYWGGRGGAKSTTIADALLLQGLQRPLRIFCAREIQKSIRESVHQLLTDRIKHYGLPYTITDTSIKGPNGTRFFFGGLWRNPESIKSVEGADICWVEEAQAVSDESWRVLIPTIRKEGSEIWASFNPKLKSDPVYRRFVLNPPANALVKKVSWRDNPWMTSELMNEMEHLRATDTDEYQHVWEGELKQFADGAVYGKQMVSAADRITKVPIEPGVPVHTFWDLGRNDTTAIWFMQSIGLQYRFIDCYEHRLVDLDHYMRVLKDKDYMYGEHYLPHDVEVITLGSGNRSRKQILEEGGVKPIHVCPRIANINEGIEQTRKKLASCWFDADRCEKGLDALRNYQYVFDEKYDTFRQTPLHNWASNYADAFRQFGQEFIPDSGAKPLEFTSEW